MKKIIISIIVVVVLLSGASVLFLYRLGDRMLEEMLLTELGSEDILLDDDMFGDMGKNVAIDERNDESDVQSGDQDLKEDNDKIDTGKVGDNGKTVAVKDNEGKEVKEPKATDNSKTAESADSGNKNSGTDVSGNDAVVSEPAGSENKNPKDNNDNLNTQKPDNEKNIADDKSGSDGSKAPDGKGNLPINNNDKGAEQKPPDKPKEQTITADKIEEIKDKVSFKDKMEISTMVLKRLSTSDINNLRKMTSNGLNDTEVDYAKDLVKSKFTEDEVVKIKDMYNKFMK